VVNGPNIFQMLLVAKSEELLKVTGSHVHVKEILSEKRW